MNRRKFKPIPKLNGALINKFFSGFVENKSGCAEWTASLNDTGYGRFYIGTESYHAHRISYYINFGTDPKEKMVCHNCDNPPCVNPKHLFLGTLQDNLRDMVNKGRHANRKKTHCKNGHKFNKENTETLAGGARRCRVCTKINRANYRRLNREKIREQDKAWWHRTRSLAAIDKIKSSGVLE